MEEKAKVLVLISELRVLKWFEKILLGLRLLLHVENRFNKLFKTLRLREFIQILNLINLTLIFLSEFCIIFCM